MPIPRCSVARGQLVARQQLRDGRAMPCGARRGENVDTGDQSAEDRLTGGGSESQPPPPG
jgi:hypothetical protein